MKKIQKGTQARTSAAKKGFYAVLALCMAAVGVAVYTGITGTLHSLEENPALEPSAPLQDTVTDDWNYPETNGEGATAVHQDTNPPKEENPSGEEDDSEKTQGEVIYTADHYHNGCMHLHNRRLVDMSRHCIYYLTHQGGGTAYTVDYAESQGLTMVPIELSELSKQDE